MQDARELIDKLNLCGKPLSKGHSRLAEYIAQHYDKAIFMTADQLGKQAQVSESTVVRFAIASEIDEGDVLRTVLKNDMQNIRKTVDALNEADFQNAVRRLESAEHIYIMGLSSAAPLAQFMYHYMHQILSDVLLVQNTTGDVFEEIARIGAKDVLVGVSFPRYSTRTLECMRFARQNGAQVIAVTDGDMSPLRAASDVCLCASTDMASFVDSLAAPLSVINALIVSLGLRRREELGEHFKRLEGIWNAHSVYIDKQDE